MVRSKFARRMFDIGFSDQATIIGCLIMVWGAFHFHKGIVLIAVICYAYASYFWQSSPESAYQRKLAAKNEKD